MSKFTPTKRGDRGHAEGRTKKRGRKMFYPVSRR